MSQDGGKLENAELRILLMKKKDMNAGFAPFPVPLCKKMLVNAVNAMLCRARKVE